MSFEPLPREVKPGDRLFLNDGLVQLLVDQIEGNDVHCTVAVGGELRSRKGLNLPSIDLGISAFTDHDRLAFSYGVHPVDLDQEPDDWCGYARRLLSELGLPCKQVLLVAGPSSRNPDANQRLELMVF